MNHFRQLLALVLLLATLACSGYRAHAQGFSYLEAFATDQGTEKALNDPAIQQGLRELLGDKYEKFLGNFDANRSAWRTEATFLRVGPGI